MTLIVSTGMCYPIWSGYMAAIIRPPRTSGRGFAAAVGGTCEVNATL